MYKKYFPSLSERINWKKLIYFDSACSYLKNIKTIEWINLYYNKFSCCSWDRESSYLGSLLANEISIARQKTKEFIWAADGDYIVFTSSTTDSINKLIYAIDEKKINTFIVTDVEHNSNFLPQYEYSKLRNIDFNIFPYKDIFNIKKLDRELSKYKEPFLFCITHSSNILGGINDIKTIASIVHKNWGYILVDDAQYICHHKENVMLNNIDFLAFSGHKLWWPTGIGILYIKKSCEDLIKYSQKVWWWTIKYYKDNIPYYKLLPDFLEWWVQDFSAIMWFSACIDFLKDMSYEKIEKYISELNEYFWKQFNDKKMWDAFEVLNLPDSHIVTLSPKYFNAQDFHQYCNYFIDDYVVSFRTWTMCADNYVNKYLNWNTNIIRLSFWIYNNKKDIESFMNIISYYLKSI